MKEPTYEDFNGSVPMYLIALKEYSKWQKKQIDGLKQYLRTAQVEIHAMDYIGANETIEQALKLDEND